MEGAYSILLVFLLNLTMPITVLIFAQTYDRCNQRLTDESLIVIKRNFSKQTRLNSRFQ
jgi:hypothetical protein